MLSSLSQLSISKRMPRKRCRLKCKFRVNNVFINATWHFFECVCILTQWNTYYICYAVDPNRCAELQIWFGFIFIKQWKMQNLPIQKDRQKTQMDYSKPIEHVLRWAIFHRSADKRKADLRNRSWNALRLAYALATAKNRSSAKIHSVN